MNNKAIKTYDDLLQEEQRLTVHLATLKVTLKEDLSGVSTGVKEKLNPVKKIKAKVKDLFVRGDDNGPALNFALNFVLDYIIRLFIPNRTSVWTKTVIPFITKNYVSNLISDEHRKIVAKYVNTAIGKVDEMFRKTTHKKNEAELKPVETRPVFTPASATLNTSPNTNPMGL